jgi:hypothetical protein
MELLFLLYSVDLSLWFLHMWTSLWNCSQLFFSPSESPCPRDITVLVVLQTLSAARTCCRFLTYGRDARTESVGPFSQYVLHDLSLEGEGLITRPDSQPDLSPPSNAVVVNVNLHLCPFGVVLSHRGQFTLSCFMTIIINSDVIDWEYTVYHAWERQTAYEVFFLSFFLFFSFLF